MRLPLRHLCLAVLALLPPSLVRAQQALDRFSYDNIRFTGIQAELGIVTSDRLKGTAQYGVRVDMGQFAPGLRLLVGASYFRSDFKSSEIRKFEDRLSQVVVDPTNDFTINLGAVHWSDLVFDADLQYMFARHAKYRPYLGLGAGIHIRNGSGQAINGTFVEDALDMAGAGLNLTGGMEVLLAPSLVLNLSGRAVLASDLKTVAVSVGLGYHIPGARR